MPDVCSLTWCFAARHRLLGGGKDPASEGLDRGIAAAILGDDELVVVIP
jgi:hypothetical protein